MASVVQYGRRRGSSNKAASAEVLMKTIQPPDLQQVTVLTKAEWQRIQDELNGVDKDQEKMREETKQALRKKSQEVVKTWSNTIAGQRQKKLEAKKIRDEIEEERRKELDREEAKYQEQKWKEATEKAQTQLFYQTDRVRGLHGALLLTEVLKEREAQIELKERNKSASKDTEKKYMDMTKTKDEENLRQEQQKALQKKLERQAVAEELKQQIKEHERLRELQKIEDMKDGAEIQHLQELYRRKQRTDEERQAQEKRYLMQAHLEHLSNRDVMRAADAQKQENEEEKRKLFLAAKEKMMKLRKDREKELFRDAQAQREKIMNKLIVTQQQQTVSEEQRIAKAVAERDAKQAQQQWEEQEKKAAMLKSITTHREMMRQEKEQKNKLAKQNNQESLQAKKEADRIFSEKQQLKAQQIKEDLRNLQDFNAAQMAEKSARHQRMTQEENNFKEKTTQIMAEEERRFQQYSQLVINAAAEAQRNVFPLCRAAREGMAGGLGPVSSGIKPVYLVQDQSGTQMPKLVSGTTQNIRKRNEATDIQEGKRRLGFTW